MTLLVVLEYALFLGAAFLVGATVIVVARWFAGWRIARTRGHTAATLPLHVWLVAASYDLFVLGMVIRVYEEGLDWPRLALYYPATVLGIIGIVVLARAQKVDR